jgi:hypothetical protein
MTVTVSDVIQIMVEVSSWGIRTSAGNSNKIYWRQKLRRKNGGHLFARRFQDLFISTSQYAS